VGYRGPDSLHRFVEYTKEHLRQRLGSELYSTGHLVGILDPNIIKQLEVSLGHHGVSKSNLNILPSGVSHSLRL